MFTNYTHFDEILITKSSGYNLWRGNNIFADITGTTYNENIKFRIRKRNTDKEIDKRNRTFKYETVLDNYYKKEQ